MARGLAILALALPMFGLVLLLWRLASRLVKSVWKRTTGKPGQRAVAVVTAAAILAVLAWAWWPDNERYRPISPNERGTITDLISHDQAAPPHPPTETEQLRPGDVNRTQLVWPAGLEQPTRRHPTLALVMVPRTPGTPDNLTEPPSSAPTEATPTAATPSVTSPTEDPGNLPGDDDPHSPAAPVWVFPFDEPLPPGPGDNQAFAVNTTDNTVVYDVAFALVWVDNTADPVTNANEAYAYASCTRCAAVAIGFQVVLVIGHADIVVPENLAGALNYNCVQCLTYALATQLVVTLEGPLSADGMAALNRLWAELADFARTVEDYPLSELRDQLTAYEQRILDVIATDHAMTLPGTTTPTSPTPINEHPPGDTPTTPSSPNEPTQVAPTDSSATPPDPTSSPTTEPTPSTSHPNPTEEPSPSETDTSPSPTTAPTTAAPTATTPSP